MGESHMRENCCKNCKHYLHEIKELTVLSREKKIPIKIFTNCGRFSKQIRVQFDPYAVNGVRIRFKESHCCRDFEMHEEAGATTVRDFSEPCPPTYEV
jgi:hypothetical protein